MSDPSADVNSIIDACQSQEDEREVSDVSEDPLKLTGEESDENDITANDEVKANDDKGLDEDAGGEKQTSGITFLLLLYHMFTKCVQQAWYKCDSGCASPKDPNR